MTFIITFVMTLATYISSDIARSFANIKWAVALCAHAAVGVETFAKSSTKTSATTFAKPFVKH